MCVSLCLHICMYACMHAYVYMCFTIYIYIKHIWQIVWGHNGFLAGKSL